MKKQPTVCYVAAHSGGHIIPCLTLAHEEKKLHPETNILFFTSSEKNDLLMVAGSHALTMHRTLPLHKPRTGLLGTLSLIARMILSCITLSYYFIRMRPKKVVCTGGFIAIPATVCARILAIPVELYELNVQPGKAITFLSSRSVKINVCFAQTQRFLPGKKCTKTAYPIRFFDDRKQMCQKEALETLNFDPARTTLTVLGGSQGSVEINNLIKKYILANPEVHDKIQIIHQIGHNDVSTLQSFYAQHNIPAHVFSFCLDLAPHYAAADLVICRSGAGTLFEVLFFGKPCLTIPLITEKNDHQLYNALAMQEEYEELFTACTVREQNTQLEELAKQIELIVHAKTDRANSTPETSCKLSHS